MDLFIDEVKIEIRSGKGGDGIVAFRREKYVPFGGPSGGDGGKGGSVIFQADEGMSTLFDLRYTKRIQAKAGENGKIKNMHGKDAEDVIVKVPVGTICFEEGTNRVICNLTKNQEEAIIAKGGRGGRGNQSFATSRNKAPRVQENGELGEVLSCRVELKLLADVGIIGFPSVGKSTLISMVTGSKPKTAPYPFTTITPNLGVVEVGGIQPFVLADMPGLIEGASLGQGLGIQFLRHIERTRVLLHVIDMSPESMRDPYQDYLMINKELGEYKASLLERPQIVVANKMDEDGAKERFDDFTKKLDPSVKVIAISAILRENLTELMLLTRTVLNQTPSFELFDREKKQDEDFLMVEFEEEGKGYEVLKHGDHEFEVVGPVIHRLLTKSNFMTDEAIMKFLQSLRTIGVENALRDCGAKDGDSIRVGDFEFDFVE